VTDWPALRTLYDALVTVAPTLGARVARAAVVGRVEGPQAGLAALEAIDGPTGGGRIQGVIATGTISAADLLVGPLAGEPLSALVELLENDEAYVNVHTHDGMGDENTGPGDFPGGEIRGQIEHRGH